VKLWFTFLLAVALVEAEPGRLDWLRGEIARHDTLYFEKAEPEITDYEYDHLKAELRRLEVELGRESSERVGSDLRKESALVPHGRPMLSLEKAYSNDEVDKFGARLWEAGLKPGEGLIVEPKYDGIAINVRMVRGRVGVAATRGDGTRGEVVTAAFAAVGDMGYRWDRSQGIEEIELRGEVIISYEAFAALNARRVAAGDEPFRHPRAVAAGSIKLTDLAEIQARGLSVVFHGWGEVVPETAAPESVLAFRSWAQGVGLPVGEMVRVKFGERSSLRGVIEQVREDAAALPTDGVVIKVDEVSSQRRLGDGPTAPRWAIARKFAPPRAETTLRQIVWQVGRSGVLTPVAEFEPVQLDGTTVARATLHNAKEVRRRDLRRGDRVVVEKAGQVIPAIVEVRTALRAGESVAEGWPEQCPSCGEAVEVDGVDLRCGNFECPDQMGLRLVHFASRGAVGIRGLGKSMATKLVEARLVRGPGDLYAVTEAELVDLPGVGPATARKLRREIGDSRAQAPWRMLVGLGLPGLGPTRAKLVAGKLQRLTDLLDAEERAEAFAALGAAARAELEVALAQPEIARTVTALHAAIVRQ